MPGVKGISETALRVAPLQMLLIVRKGATVNPLVTPGGAVPPHDGSGQLSEWRATLEGHGVEIESEMEWPKGGQSLYLRDPDQHCIELKTSDWDASTVSDESSGRPASSTRHHARPVPDRRPLGAGGMGEVYKATDTDLPPRVEPVLMRELGS